MAPRSSDAEERHARAARPLARGARARLRVSRNAGLDSRGVDAAPSRDCRETTSQTVTGEDLRRLLAEPLPGLAAQLRMAPDPRTWPEEGAPLRPAAALLLLYPQQDEWYVPLTVRAPGLRHHTSQVSLPGGRLDRPDESPEEAALREAEEEIGVRPADVDVLGRLTPVPIAVSAHLLHPVVGLMKHRPGFAVAAHEVAQLIELPLVKLMEPGVVRSEQRLRAMAPHVMQSVPYFDVGGARIWGATAMVLAEFLAVLERTR